MARAQHAVASLIEIEPIEDADDHGDQREDGRGAEEQGAERFHRRRFTRPASSTRSRAHFRG
jgi:hypothetical protein